MTMHHHGEEDLSYSNTLTIISDSIMLIDIAETYIIILHQALYHIINGIMSLFQ